MEDINFNAISIEGYNYCSIHQHEIDYELVREIKPKCIEEHNGCGNCPRCVYITEMKVKNKDGEDISEKTRTPG